MFFSFCPAVLFDCNFECMLACIFWCFCQFEQNCENFDDHFSRVIIKNPIFLKEIHDQIIAKKSVVDSAMNEGKQLMMKCSGEDTIQVRTYVISLTLKNLRAIS